MPDETILRVRALLAEYESKYRNSAARWKFSYRALLIVSAMLSAGAAIIGKLEYRIFDNISGSDIVAILAAMAAVITTVIAALDFEVNWRINRRSRHEVDVIALESEKSTANADALLAELQEVIRKRNDDLNKQD